MSDYDNRPTFLREALEEWYEQHKRRRGFFERLYWWVVVGLPWRSTEWAYPTLHGISTASYPNWDQTDQAPKETP